MRRNGLWQRIVCLGMVTMVLFALVGAVVPAQSRAEVASVLAGTVTPKLEQLRDALAQALAAQGEAEQELEAAQGEQNAAQASYDDAVAETERLSKDAANKKSAWTKAESASVEAANKLASAQSKLDKNASDIAATKAEVSQAQADKAAASTTLEKVGQRVSAAEKRVQSAQAAVRDAEAVIATEVPDPRSNEGHREWTAYGFFQYVRDNAAYGSAQYWDAQCAMDILDGGKNTTGHTYAYNQGPSPDGTYASKWTNIASNIAWAQRGDAVGLDNFRTSLKLLEEFNAIRAEENAAEGTSLRTDIGTNCRQMAISIVQCDTSKDYSVSHTQAYEGLENLSWSSACCTPFSRGRYTDPYVGWYDEEKINYKQQNGGVTGHYTTIVDLNSGYFCEIAGFAVCNYQASYGECRELSTFGDFFEWDTNPTPEVQYSLADMTSMFDAYYDMQVEAEMFGTTEAVKAEHRSVLNAAQAELDAAKAELASVQSDQQNAQTALDTATQHLADAKQCLSDLQSKTKDLQLDVTAKTKASNQARADADSAKRAYDAAQAAVDAYEADGFVASARAKLDAATGEVAAAKKVLANATSVARAAQGALDAYANLSTNDGVTVTCANTTYTGKALTPKVSVSIDGVALIANEDYAVAYSNNTKAGTGIAKITGAGNYTGVVQAEFVIKKSASSITLAAQTKTYNGKALAYTGKVTKKGSKGAVTYRYYSDAACTKGVKSSNVKSAGTYYVKATLAADANYKAAKSAAVKLTIAKATNPLTLKAVKRTAKLAQVKKAKVVVARPLTVSKAQGTLKYKKVSGSTALSVDAKTGKVTVKKGTKKGTYKIKIKVTAAGNANYKARSRAVTCSVVVK